MRTEVVRKYEGQLKIRSLRNATANEKTNAPTSTQGDHKSSEDP